MKAVFLEKYRRWKEGKLGTSVLRKPLAWPLLAEYTRRIVKELRWTGIGHLDFVGSRDDDRAWVLEMNPRFWGALNMAVQNGFDFPMGLITMYTKGEPDQRAFSSRPSPVKSLWALGELISGLQNSGGSRTTSFISSLGRTLLPGPDVVYDDIRWGDPLATAAEAGQYFARFFSVQPIHQSDRTGDDALIAACPLCGKKADAETKFKGIFRCIRHGAFEWFDRGLLDNVNLIAAYQSYPYNRSVGNDFERMKPAYIPGLLRRVLKYHPKAEGLSFLDVGCANGEYLAAARALGMCQTEGVEIDEEAREKAASRGRVYSNMDEIQGRYNIVQCKNVLSNISDPVMFLDGLLGRTKPGGVVFLDVLNQFGLLAQIKKALNRPGTLKPPFVINGFSKKSVAELINRKGVKVAWLGTTYAGSDLLPYRRSVGLVARGWATNTIGMASMIAEDIIPGQPDA